MQNYTRTNLAASLQYHSALADHYKKAASNGNGDEQRTPSEEQEPPPEQNPDEYNPEQNPEVSEPESQPQPQSEENDAEQQTNAKLAELHSDVANQLREVLAANPPTKNAAEMRADRPVTRMQSRTMARDVVLRRATMH